MRSFKEFLKSSLLAAAGVLLPLLLLIVIFEKILILFGSITTPFARVIFPAQFAASAHATRLATFIVLLIAAMLLGLVAQTETGKKTGRWLEDHTFMHLKIYRTIKEFSDRLLPSEGNTMFQPALLIREDEMNTLVFIVEVLDESQYVIFVPSAPSTLSGALYIVPKTDLKLIDVSPREVAKVFSRWGVGTTQILRESHSAKNLQGEDRLHEKPPSSPGISVEI